jgi:hypothetical protein
MGFTPKRLRLILLMGVLTLASGFVSADAQSGSLLAVSGTWTMSSDPNESIANGRSYSFSTPDDGLELGSHLGSTGVGVFARPAGTSDLWNATFYAAAGQQLLPGVYNDARRFPDATHPGMDVGGAGHGCNATEGQFTVLDVSYGPYGYLKSLHVTFEQHCEGFAEALRGEINLVGPPPPPPLVVRLTVNDTSGFDRSAGSLQLHGTITCSQTVQAGINGTVSETTKKGEASAYLHFFSQDVGQECSPTPMRWKIKVVSATENPFTAGSLHTELTLSAMDNYYSVYNGGDPFIYATDSLSPTPTAKPAVRRANPGRRLEARTRPKPVE